MIWLRLLLTLTEARTENNHRAERRYEVQSYDIMWRSWILLNHKAELVPVKFWSLNFSLFIIHSIQMMFILISLKQPDVVECIIYRLLGHGLGLVLELQGGKISNILGKNVREFLYLISIIILYLRSSFISKYEESYTLELLQTWKCRMGIWIRQIRNSYVISVAPHKFSLLVFRYK